MILGILNKAIASVKPLASNTALIALFAATIAGGADVPQALATDGKNYPGSLCVRWSGSTEIVYNFGQIGNDSSKTWLHLDCPAVKDSHSIIRSWVRVWDRQYGQYDDIYCRLYSMYLKDSGGMSGWFGPEAKSEGGGGAQMLETGSPGDNSLSHYYFSCRIPPTDEYGRISYIATYNVVENE